MGDAATSPDGIEIRFEAAGSGAPALILVHGWSCDRTYWRGQLGPLAARHRVVAVDLAGHGESGAGREAWTMPAYGGDVAAVVDHLGLDDVVLVGHSMGGDVVVEAALLLGDHVRGLVWVDVYTSLGEPATPEEVGAFIDRFRGDYRAGVARFVRERLGPRMDRGLLDWIAEDMAAGPPEIGLDEAEHAVSNEQAAMDGLARLDAPIVAINADFRPSDEASLLRHRIRTVILPGTDHFLMLEAPERFNAVLEEVVAGFARG
jgi:pimeloyl-ACP methyl ester carboxylesterase